MEELAKKFEPSVEDSTLFLADRGLAEFEKQLARIKPTSETANFEGIVAAALRSSSAVNSGSTQHNWFVSVAVSWCGGSLAGAVMTFLLLRGGTIAREQPIDLSQSTQDAATSDLCVAATSDPVTGGAAKPISGGLQYLSSNFNWDLLDSSGVQLTVLNSRRFQRPCCFQSPSRDNVRSSDDSSILSSDYHDLDQSPPSTRQSLMRQLLN